MFLNCQFCLCPFRSGFFLFCADNRPGIKAQHPSLGIGDVAKRLGEMWNNLSDSEKQPFLSKANKLKDKYQKVRSCIFLYTVICPMFHRMRVLGLQLTFGLLASV